MDARSSDEQKEEAMLKGEEILTFILAKLEDELHSVGLSENSPLTNVPATRKEFLYKSWLAAEREIETSTWAGSVIDGSLVVQAEVEYEGQGVKITCDELTLEIAEQTQDTMTSTFVVSLSGSARDKITLDLEVFPETDALFRELCTSVVEFLSKLILAKKVKCEDNLVNILTLLEDPSDDHLTIEIPKRSQPTLT